MSDAIHMREVRRALLLIRSGEPRKVKRGRRIKAQAERRQRLRLMAVFASFGRAMSKASADMARIIEAAPWAALSAAISKGLASGPEKCQKRLGAIASSVDRSPP